jgi:hypothetical protein
MFAMELEGVMCGIIARTIGGPYAVLIAEQLQAAGAKLIIGLTSAGRLASELPLPCLVVATSAIRDEGTSYHYLPPGGEVACKSPLVPLQQPEISSLQGCDQTARRDCYLCLNKSNFLGGWLGEAKRAGALPPNSSST